MLRVGVLMGGRSIEREVSFNSGRTVCDHLDSTRYAVIPIFQCENGDLFLLPWHFLHRGKTSDFEHRLAREAKPVMWDEIAQLVDFIYIAVHGNYAEDGILQGTLELFNIPYLGAKRLASALGMDKIMQKSFLRDAGVITARDFVIFPHELNALTVDDLQERLKKAEIALPCIIKPYREGSSLGVACVRTIEECIDAIEHAALINGKPQKVLVEEYVNGMEFSCITITNYRTGQLMPLPPTEIVPDSGDIFDYEQKYMPGRAHKFTPARCSQEIIERIQATCVAVHNALGFSNLSRIDGIVRDDGSVLILDPNSLSGMAPSSFLFREAAEIGMSHSRLINHLIETELHAMGRLAQLEEKEKKQETMNNTKIRVAVLMGGDSNEREISLESGRNVYYKLPRDRYHVLPLFVTEKMALYEISEAMLVLNSTREIAAQLADACQWRWHELPNKIDFAFIGLHGGRGENGCVQAMLEMLDVPYNGSSVLASALCMDKHKTNQFLASHGCHVPASRLITQHEWAENADAILAEITAFLTAPWIAKPHDDGCSVLVQALNTADELKAHIAMLFAQGKTHALVEECVQGMELTVGVIGNDVPIVLPASHALSAQAVLSLHEKFLPGAGENQTPAPLNAQESALVEKEVKRAYELLNCRGYVRIDCFFQPAAQSPTKKDRVIVLEVNTLPGLTPATCLFHQAAEIGMRPSELLDHIVSLGLEERGAKGTQTSQIGKKSRELTARQPGA